MRAVTLILFFLAWLPNLVAQVTLQTNEQVSGYASLPQENTFVHSNATFFLTGEYLYYKLYCVDSKAGNLTKLSKVAYVELVGEGNKSIFLQKVLLENGMGQGDFFIPTDIDSGAYKLIAYTNWMLNQDQDSFYQGDIIIVNPYRSNQPELQTTSEIQSDSLTKTTFDSISKPIALKEIPKAIGPIQIETNGSSFQKRAKVSVVLKGREQNEFVVGNYSLSVRKRSRINEVLEQNSSDLFTGKNKIEKKNASVGNSIFLPELRGELFQANVVALQDDKSVRNLKVAVSIPGEDYALEVVQTDEMGIFQFNIAKSYSGEDFYLQVLSQNPEAYKIEIYQLNTLDYSKLDFKEINIDFSMREEILRRSIHNQIENSYFQFRPDSVLAIPPKHFFDTKEKKTYLLDDFTRFKTLRETLVEIVQDVFSKRIGRDNYVIRVKGYDYASVADIAPMILLDGCFIQDYNKLLEFDARLIEEIEVFRHKFVYGPDVFEGAMLITTKKGNGYESFQDNGFMSISDILKPQPIKKYFTQRYDSINNNASDSRLPDDRFQLLWMPSLKVEQDELEIDFFTSDVSGEFEIHLEGITRDNQVVSIRKYFSVE